MQELVNRLQENRQIELAKSILERNEYKVSKKLRESDDSSLYFSDELKNDTAHVSSLIDDIENFGGKDEFEAYYGIGSIDLVCEYLHCNIEDIYTIDHIGMEELGIDTIPYRSGHNIDSEELPCNTHRTTLGGAEDYGIVALFKDPHDSSPVVLLQNGADDGESNVYCKNLQ